MSDSPQLGTVTLPDDSQLGLFDVVSPVQEQKEKPGLFETGAAAFRQYNDVVRAGKWFYDKSVNNFNADVPDDFNAKAEGYLDKVPKEFWGKILACDTRNEADYMVQNINQELADKDTMARAGGFTSLATTLGASIISPTTLLPLSQTIKYAKIGKTAFANALQTSKSLVPAVALQNAILTGTKQTEGYKEWVQDTILDSFVGASIAGAVGAFAAKGISKELDGARAFFKSVDDDVTIKYRLNENGEVVGMQAVPLEGGSVGAARVQTIQQLLDTQEVSFKDNKLIKHYFGFAQPVIRGLTSPFAVVRNYTGSLFNNPFMTSGGVSRAIQDPAAENFIRIWRGSYSSLQTLTKQKWLDYLDIKGPAKGIRGAIGEFSGKTMPEKMFNEHVAKAVRRNGFSDIPQVSEVANSWIKELYEPLLEELKKRRPDFKEHDFTNIQRYLNRVYNKGMIQERPDDFVNDLVSYFSKRNDRLMSLKKPINDIAEKNKDLTKQLKEFKSVSKSADASRKGELAKRIKEIEKEISSNKELVSGMNKKIEEDVLSGKIEMDLLEEKPFLSAEQLQDIEKLNAPVKKAETALSEAKASKDKKKIKEAKENLKKAQSELDEALESANVDSSLFTVDRGKKKLKQAQNAPKLRGVLSDQEVRMVSEGIRDSILQENEEQLVGKLFDNIQSGGSNPLKDRTVLWNDTEAEPWLLNDINVLGGVYMDQLTKRMYADDVFLKYGINPREGQKGMAGLLKKEYDEMRNKILEKPASDARSKELNALQKSFNKEKDFIEDSYKVYMGTYADRSAMPSRVAQGLKQFASATLLGNVPILQLTDFFTPMFKFMFSEYVFDGLVSTINRIKYVAKEQIKEMGGGESSFVRGAFADVNLGNNVAHGARMEAMWGYGAQHQPKTVLERYVTNLANVSQNLSLSNYITDFQETMVSFTSQSSLIRTAKKFLNGDTLSKQEIAKMDLARFNPDKYAQRIVNQFQTHGKDVEGAFLANFHLWDDIEASLVFRSAIEKEVRSVITKPNLLDVPFGFRNPYISLATQFMSWSMAATTNFTLPTITNPDKQKITGLVLMLASSALIDPLRQLAKGEEVNLDFEALAASAFTNSGFFGWHFQEIQKINSALDLPFLRPFQSDRFRKKEFSSLFAGPTAGILNDAANVISALANGEMNTRDAQRAINIAIPGAGNWYLRKLVHDSLESTGMPKNRYQAKRLKELD